MAAAITVLPAQPETGTPVVVSGSGFNEAAVVTVAVPQIGLSSEIVADHSGAFGTDDIADHAYGTLTAASNVVADDTVTLGAVTYTFKDTFSTGPTVANEVKVGTDAATSLANLKKAINATGTAGTEYSVGTVIHPTITALTLTATTLEVYAKTSGTGGNALTSTEASTHLSFGGTTLAGGSAASGVSSMILDFEEPGTYAITATDGTNSATATVQVFSK
jgi:hypothetical protein